MRKTALGSWLRVNISGWLPHLRPMCVAQRYSCLLYTSAVVCYGYRHELQVRKERGETEGTGEKCSKAVEAIARQPEAESKISKALRLGCALAEATAIYGFVIGLLIIIMLGS